MTHVTFDQTVPTVRALESLPPNAQSLLRILALLDDSQIQEDILQHKDAQKILSSYPLDTEYEDAMSMLTQISLVHRNKQLKTLSIHNLVQDVARQSMEGEEFSKAFQATLLLLTLEWEEIRLYAFGHRLSDWQMADKILPHVMKLVTHFRKQQPPLPLAALVMFTSLITRSSIHLKERCDWVNSISMAMEALSLIEMHPGDMAEQRADVLMSLSATYHCLGDPVLGPQYARLHFEQRVLNEDPKPLEGKDLGDTAMAYTELALAALMKNDYDEAISLASQGRAILVKTRVYLEDTYWPHWADYHHAWALIGLGRAEEARPILTKILEWRVRHYGNDDTESMKAAYTLQILGAVNEKTGRIDDAIDCWERALPLFCRTEGDSSFRTNQVRVKLAEYHGRHGSPKIALHYIDTALKYFTGEKYYKAERARTLFKKSEVFKSIGSLGEARSVKEEADRLYGDVCAERGMQRVQDPVLEDFDSIVMIMYVQVVCKANCSGWAARSSFVSELVSSSIGMSILIFRDAFEGGNNAFTKETTKPG